MIYSLAVCGAPATIFLDNTVVEFRRSPAAVVHQDRHHAVVLTELFPDTLLDQAPKLWHLRVLGHVQLDDDPRTPIQQSVGEEFRQHDGVVTVLVKNNLRRASPKHYETGTWLGVS